jgi:hypothetical protein
LKRSSQKPREPAKPHLPPQLAEALRKQAAAVSDQLLTITHRAKAETAKIPDVAEAHKKAIRLANEWINSLPREIRNRVRVVFERNKWKQLRREGAGL